MGIRGPRDWCGAGLLMFTGLRFSSLAGVVRLTVDLGVTTTPTDEVGTFGGGFEGYAMGSLTSMRGHHRASWLVRGEPPYVHCAQVFIACVGSSADG